MPLRAMLLLLLRVPRLLRVRRLLGAPRLLLLLLLLPLGWTVVFLERPVAVLVHLVGRWFVRACVRAVCGWLSLRFFGKKKGKSGCFGK